MPQGSRTIRSRLTLGGVDQATYDACAGPIHGAVAAAWQAATPSVLAAAGDVSSPEQGVDEDGRFYVYLDLVHRSSSNAIFMQLAAMVLSCPEASTTPSRAPWASKWFSAS